MTASDKDRLGHPVRPANRFGPATRQVAVLVHLGAIPKPGRLSIDWYTVGPDGKEARLTRRHVAVRGHEWAWSVGRAAGPVRPGHYEAVARLGGSELATWFVVGDLQPPALPRAAAAGAQPGAKSILVSSSRATTPNSEWSQWSEGAASDEPAAAPGGSPAKCSLMVYGEALVIAVDAVATGFHGDRCGRVTLSAGISGPPVEQASGDERAAEFIDPCTLPGGTDAPGTVVELAASAEKGAPASDSVMLIDLGLSPMVVGKLNPADGTKVHAGDTIAARIGAVQIPFATGIHKVDIYGDGELIGTWTRPGDEPKPCDQRKWVAAFDITYDVPANPPPVVELYARAEDYAGRVGWAVWHFPTQGTTWTGKVVGNLHQNLASGTQIGYVELEAILTEDADGKITGVLDGGQTQDLDLEVCPSTTSSPGRVHAEVTGTHKGDTVSLDLGRVDFTPPGVTPCPGTGPPATLGPLIDPLFPPLGKALDSVVKQKDGMFHSEADGTYGNAYPYTVSYTIDLKPTN